MGAIGGILRAGKTPKFDLQTQVKNPEIQKALAGLLGDFGSDRTAQNRSLGDFTSRWLAAQPGAEQSAAQEAAAVGQYYNGGIEKILASLRARREKAVMDQANRAIQYATRNRSLANLAAEGGDSSYNRRLGIGQTTDILTQAALDNSNRERADFDTVQQGKMSLLGKRQGVLDAATGRIMYPATLRQGLLAGNARNLGGLSNIDLANTFYGLTKKSSRGADIWDAIDTGILNVLSAYGGGGFQVGGSEPKWTGASGEFDNSQVPNKQKLGGGQGGNSTTAGLAGFI